MTLQWLNALSDVVGVGNSAELQAVRKKVSSQGKHHDQLSYEINPFSIHNKAKKKSQRRANLEVW
jgi:hypothetical protein